MTHMHNTCGATSRSAKSCLVLFSGGFLHTGCRESYETNVWVRDSHFLVPRCGLTGCDFILAVLILSFWPS